MCVCWAKYWQPSHELLRIGDDGRPVETLAVRLTNQRSRGRMMIVDPFVNVEKEIPALVARDASLQHPRDAAPVKLVVNNGQRLRPTGESSYFSLVCQQLPV